MRKIGKLCMLLICFAMIFGGCSQPQGNTDGETKETGETAAGTTGSESAEKAILHQSPEEKLVFTFDYDPSSYLKMKGDYQSVVLAKANLNVTEDDIQQSVDALLLEHVKLEEVKDREAMTGDTLDIDFTGTLDGEEIYNEKNYRLELGSGGMVSGFEESLEGSKEGDQIKLDLEYPKDYGDELLNGKTVHFEVEVHKVYLPVVPDYTDEFVAKYTEYDTIEAYEASIQSDLEQAEKEDAIALWMDEHTTLENCPDSIKEEYGQRMLDHFEMLAKYFYDTDLDGLLKKMNYTSKEEFLESNEEDIEADIKKNLGYEYVVSKENLQSTVKDYVAYMDSYAQMTGYKDADELLDYFTEQEMRQLYIKKLATDWILEHASIQNE